MSVIATLLGCVTVSFTAIIVLVGQIFLELVLFLGKIVVSVSFTGQDG